MGRRQISHDRHSWKSAGSNSLVGMTSPREREKNYWEAYGQARFGRVAKILLCIYTPPCVPDNRQTIFDAFIIEIKKSDLIIPSSPLMFLVLCKKGYFAESELCI